MLSGTRQNPAYKLAYYAMHMKTIQLLFLLLIGIVKLPAQLPFVGFDQPLCAAPISNSYTYSNYSLGGGSSTTYGYKIYRNGLEVYNTSGSMGTGQFCSDLIFINDSTGFAVGGCGMCGNYVLKTSNYGITWNNIGSTALGYMGLYIVNSNYCYLVTSPNNYQFFIEKCTDVETPSLLVYDDSINTDVYKTDTIMGSSLCGIDSLNVLIKNAVGDTVDYHINFQYIPLGIYELTSISNPSVVYPNPAMNSINISCNEFQKAEIYSINWAFVKEGYSKTVTIEDLSRGIYFIKVIHTNGEIQYLKFSKQE